MRMQGYTSIIHFNFYNFRKVKQNYFFKIVGVECDRKFHKAVNSSKRGKAVRTSDSLSIVSLFIHFFSSSGISGRCVIGVAA